MSSQILFFLRFVIAFVNFDCKTFKFSCNLYPKILIS
jgi:hypothetical protein